MKYFVCLHQADILHTVASLYFFSSCLICNITLKTQWCVYILWLIWFCINLMITVLCNVRFLNIFYFIMSCFYIISFLLVLPKVTMWTLAYFWASSWSFCKSKINKKSLLKELFLVRAQQRHLVDCCKANFLSAYFLLSWRARHGSKLYYHFMNEGIKAGNYKKLYFKESEYLRTGEVSCRGYNLPRWETSTRQTFDHLQPESAVCSCYQHRATVFKIHSPTHRYAILPPVVSHTVVY